MFAAAVRRLLLRPRFAEPEDLTGRTAVVTGCGPRSLGFATAAVLARWGARVLATTRSGDPALEARLRSASGEVPKGRISLHALELGDTGSVDAFARSAAEACNGRLDVLVNNAGIHLDLMSRWKEPQLTPDGFELHWRINYLGTLQLTHRLLPALLRAAQASGDARVVNVVSTLHRRGSNDELATGPQPYDSWAAYGLSKLALVHFSFELQRRHAGRGLQAWCVHPGSVDTPVGVKGMATSPRWQTAVRVLSPLQSLFMLSPEEGAQTQILCATERGLQGGRYFRNCAATAPSDDALDPAAAEQLWRSGEQWLAALDRHSSSGPPLAIPAAAPITRT